MPADRKWFTRLVVSAAIIDAIESLDPRFPEVDPEVRAEFARLKEELEKEAAQAKEGKEPKDEPAPKEQKKAKAEKAEKADNAEKAEKEKPA